MDYSTSSSPGTPKLKSRERQSVSPSYSRVSETLRRLSTGSVQCSLFCGGARCKYERGERWRDDQKALKGVFSHWVTPEILAMARPSTRLFREEGLVEQLKELGIGTVINLQLPWEHSKCGPGMESSGFTYHPEDAMKHGVYFYNYGWMDYGVPTLESVLDMVKVLDFAVQDGKVAIHCHAGLGRTGVLIACYLIYSHRLTGDKAIAFVRERRPGSIQTRPQIELVQQFDLFIRPLWTFYPSLPPSSSSLTFDEYLTNQLLILHGVELQRIKYTPKAVCEVCKALRKVCSSTLLHPGGRTLPGECTGDAIPVNDQGCKQWLVRAFLQDWTETESLQAKVLAILSEMNSNVRWSLLEKESDPCVLFSLLLLFFQGLKEPFLCTETDLVVLADKPSTDVLPLGKSLTLQCVLNALKEVFTRETLSTLGHPVASRLAQALLQTSSLTDHTSTTVGFIISYWSV